MEVSFFIALGLHTGCDAFRSHCSPFATSFFFAEGVALKSRLACHTPLSFTFVPRVYWMILYLCFLLMMAGSDVSSFLLREKGIDSWLCSSSFISPRVYVVPLV